MATKKINVSCDYVPTAMSSKKNNFEAMKVAVSVCYAGDGFGERTADIISAIRTAYNAANNIG